MKLGRKLLYNTALLTASSLVMRCIGLAYQVWLVGRIGQAGIGLFQLVMSVGMLGSTFAVSGIRFAATRLVSQEVGMGLHGGVGRTMRRCCAYSLFFGTAAATVLFSMAEPVGFLWIGDARTVLPLKILALSLPFISLSSVFAGYFTAMGRVYKSAAVQISEQLFRIALVSAFLKMAPEGDLQRSCSAVVAAGTLAEVFSLTLIVILYFLDRRRYSQPGSYSQRLTGRMLGVALPLAFSAYARTSLSTLEQLLVPRGLKSSGMSADQALSGYGVIQGMVFPIISFPSCFLMALAEMLVPEMTEAQVSGRTEYISKTATTLIHRCLMFAFGAAALLFSFADDLGMAIYGSAEAGRYIRIFSLLTPVMYLDMVTDGMLKGLGQQMYSMAYNIMDAMISVILVYTILPQYALNGYIAIICFTECFNFTLSIRRLSKVTELRLRFRKSLLPAVCALGAAQACRLAVSVCGVPVSSSIPAIVFSILLGAGIYLVLLYLCGCIGGNKSGNGTVGGAVRDTGK